MCEVNKGLVGLQVHFCLVLGKMCVIIRGLVGS
jgi:hypothetical protein